MNAMFRNIGTNDIGSPPPSPLDVDTNKRNELREIAASLTKSKKKQATVCTLYYHGFIQLRNIR